MPSNDELQRQIDSLRQSLRGSTVGPSVFSGGLSRVATRDALPTASADFAYALVVILGAPDVMYVCLRDSSAGWEWVQVATGTA